MRNIRLRDGASMPAIGLGTWKSAPGDVGAAVRTAVELGYRHIDCAAIYGNEAEIGTALAECFADGIVAREDLFITSKLWNDRHARLDVEPALEDTLADLKLDYLDLYLMHWPIALVRGVSFPRRAADMVPLEAVPLAETWRAMAQSRDRGLCRHVGVSNFSARKIEGLLTLPLAPPDVNQIELHPYLQQQSLVDFCAGHEIAVTAYSPLGSRDRNPALKPPDEPSLLDDTIIGRIASRLGATPAQVLLAWALERGTAVIPKSVSPGRLAENLAAGQLELGDQDLLAIKGLDRHRRYVSGTFWELPEGPYTVAALWDE